MLAEAKTTSLADIRPANAHSAMQGALMRLQLWTAGQTHKLMLDTQQATTSAILSRANADGSLDSTAVFLAQNDIIKIYTDRFFQPWTALMTYSRRQAAMLPFGVLAIKHEQIKRQVDQLNESVRPPNPTGGGVFDQQLRVIIDAMNTRTENGLNLSGRIWRIDREAREGIQNVLMQAIADKKSAWETAKLLEQFLGANEDCPRWTSTRLNMSKADIAASKRGLITGDACAGQGVSYNALRLARTEIQFAHHAANDALMARSPGVIAEQIHLSAGHSGSDICDETVVGGEENDGVYPVGTIELPLHPNCICYKTSVQMPWDEFGGKLQGWMDSTQAWPEMDAYQDFVGGDLNTDLFKNPFAQSLEIWLLEKVGDYVSG